MSHSTFIQFNQVSFQYPSSHIKLFSDVSLSFSIGWTGIVGANGVGKTTLLQLASNALNPEKGNIKTKGSIVYCPQSVEFPPEKLENLIYDTNSETGRLKSILEIQDDWFYNWNTLSQGEKKKIQIALALSSNPSILALDEPTNHIDKETKDTLFQVLSKFTGVGLLVTHDRYLLENLVSQCLFIENSHQITLRPGTYSQGLEQREIEKQTILDEYQKTKKEKQKLQQEFFERREKASRSHKKRSKKGLAIKDHDSRFKINLARLSGKDGQDGKLTNQIRKRVERIEELQNSIGNKLKKDATYKISFERNSNSRNIYFYSENEWIRQGELNIYFEKLCIQKGDRIGITGKNGTGKTSLIEYILKNNRALSEDILYIPQEISEKKTKEILNNFQQFPKEERGSILTIVAQLGSSIEQILATSITSPGETRKLLLSMGIHKNPSIIFMDEPTNHIDLPAIEAIENALKSVTSSLVVISHDMNFLFSFIDKRWHLSKDKNNQTRVEVF